MNWSDFWAGVDARISRALARLPQVRQATLSGLSGSGKAVTTDAGGLADEVHGALEVMQQEGFRSVPSESSEAIVLQVGGPGGHRIVIATANRATAPTDLVAGDVAIYSSVGARVLCKADGSVVLTTPAGGSLELTADGGISAVPLEGQLVGLNGTDKAVARVGDTASPSAAMAAWLSGVGAVASAMTGGAVPATPPDPTYAIATGSTVVKTGVA